MSIGVIAGTGGSATGTETAPETTKNPINVKYSALICETLLKFRSDSSIAGFRFNHLQSQFQMARRSLRVGNHLAQHLHG
ncbi:hypothetical protein SDC9_121386 [bioreactor metagenome]|uniref:Uncharacterized protein n=1 Tax=bioreactor metagenome TaxID=1076179 RepID=A0A645CBY5_9ZZZZ